MGNRVIFMAVIRSAKPMRAAKISCIVMSAAMCLLGAAFIFLPDVSLGVMTAIAGVLITAFGVAKLAGYFSKDLYRLAFQYDLAFGALFVLLGVFVLMQPDSAVNIVCAAVGIAVLADGLLKIQTALDSRRFGIRSWLLILLLALCTCAAGVLLIFRPAESARAVTVIFGISLFAEGILSLATVVSAVKVIKHQRSDGDDGGAYVETDFAGTEDKR